MFGFSNSSSLIEFSNVGCGNQALIFEFWFRMLLISNESMNTSFQLFFVVEKTITPKQIIVLYASSVIVFFAMSC